MPISVSRPAADVEALSYPLAQAHKLHQAQKGDRQYRSEDNLDNDMGDIELGVNHEVEALEGLIRLVDAMDKVEHLRARNR